MKSWPETEVELARPIVAWLLDLGWEVFQEVCGWSASSAPSGPRADIVARRGRVLWVIEVKRSLDLTVLGQAHIWKRRAHRVSVAVPFRRDSTGRDFALLAAAGDGIGVLVARHVYDGEIKVVEHLRPELRRRVLGIELVESQKTWAEAGNAEGKRWSPFKQTCKLVREVVEQTPGLTIREVVDRVDHHYASVASARGSLLTWARAGRLDGVKVLGGTKTTGHLRLYPSSWPEPDEAREDNAVQLKMIGVTSG